MIKGAEYTLANNDVHLAVASYHIVAGEQTFPEVEHTLNEFGYDTITEFPQHLTTYGSKGR